MMASMGLSLVPVAPQGSWYKPSKVPKYMNPYNYPRLAEIYSYSHGSGARLYSFCILLYSWGFWKAFEGILKDPL